MKAKKNTSPVTPATAVLPGVPEAAPTPVSDTRKTILVSVTGQSPAVLTETIWALAGENPPIIPHRVVAVTTSDGRKALIRDLLKPDGGCVWDRLAEALQAQGHDLTDRLKFGQTHQDIRVFTMFDPANKRNVELPDITNEPQNLAAADFIMEQVRGLADDGVRLVGSVAGGRKTMGALLFAVMSLIGRRDDLLTHVLINEPFDSPGLKPRFYFPVTPAITHVLFDREGNPARDRDGKPISKRSDEARILLGRIPFVALRTLFERDVLESPTYSALVERCQQRSEDYAKDYAKKNTQLKIHRSRQRVSINDQDIRTSVGQHLYLLFLATRTQRGEADLPSYAAAFQDFNEFSKATWSQRDKTDGNDWRDEAMRNFDTTQMERFCVKMKNELMVKLKAAGPKALQLYLLLPEAGRFRLDLPPNQIMIVD